MVNVEPFSEMSGPEQGFPETYPEVDNLELPTYVECNMIINMIL